MPPLESKQGMSSDGIASLADKKDIHVLVTGYGAFGDNEVNPSYLIAQALKRTYTLQLPPSHNSPTIHIHAWPRPLRVSYKAVRAQIPALLFDPSDSRDDATSIPNFDLVIHIGLATGRSSYTCETLAHRQGYTQPDVDGAIPSRSEAVFWRDVYHAPLELRTGFEGQRTDVLRRWRARLNGHERRADGRGNGDGNVDVELSDDAGRYLCDFVFYTSLCEYWRRGFERAPVVFMHVPGGEEEADVERGRSVAENLLFSLIESTREGAMAASSEDVKARL